MGNTQESWACRLWLTEHLHMWEVSRGAGDDKRPIQVRQVGGSNMTLEGENHWMSAEDVGEEGGKNEDLAGENGEN